MGRSGGKLHWSLNPDSRTENSSEVPWHFFKQIKQKFKTTTNEPLYLTMGIFVLLCDTQTSTSLHLYQQHVESTEQLSYHSSLFLAKGVPYPQLFRSGQHSGWWWPWRSQFFCRVHCFEQNWVKERSVKYNLSKPPLTHTSLYNHPPNENYCEKKLNDYLSSLN